MWQVIEIHLKQIILKKMNLHEIFNFYGIGWEEREKGAGEGMGMEREGGGLGWKG